MNILQRWKNLKFWQRNTIWAIILGLLLFYFPIYGLTFPPCIYRDHPGLRNDPTNIQFTLKPDVNMVTLEQNSCSPILSNLKIIRHRIFNSPSSSSREFPIQNQTFLLSKTFYHRHYGISAIDSNTQWW